MVLPRFLDFGYNKSAPFGTLIFVLNLGIKIPPELTDGDTPELSDGDTHRLCGTIKNHRRKPP